MKNGITNTITLFIILSFLISCEQKEEVIQAPETIFKVYMRSTGDDTNTGLDFAHAVQSLKRVQEILYEWSPNTDIEVHINQGTYFQQRVDWTFTNGKKITFTPIDFTKDRPIFDGEGQRERWFSFEFAKGENTNLHFRYLKIRNYKLAVYLRGDRDNELTGWNGGNDFYQMQFENIGNKYTIGKNLGVAVIDFVNSRNNTVRYCTFTNVENLKPDELSHLHALYLAHYSSNNEVKGCIFKNICGDPIKTRDRSNFNKIHNNYFTKTGLDAFYFDGYCDPSAYTSPETCTKTSGECPSFGNEFRDNDCNKNYWGEKPNLFRLYGTDNYCGVLPTSRLRTSGNKNY